VNGRAAARCGEWAQHFSNASCFNSDFVFCLLVYMFDAFKQDFAAAVTTHV